MLALCDDYFPSHQGCRVAFALNNVPSAVVGEIIDVVRVTSFQPLVIDDVEISVIAFVTKPRSFNPRTAADCPVMRCMASGRV